MLHELDGRRADRPLPLPFSHIFVATDFSCAADQAVARAARLPLSDGGTISIAHVLPAELPRKVRTSSVQAARRLISQTVSALSQSISALGRQSVHVASALYQGQAYVEIVRHARSQGAELIVLGRHGSRPLRDMLIGRTAERVIRTGELPVLVVNRKPTRRYLRPLFAVALEDTCLSTVGTGLRVLGPEVKSATLLHAYHVPFEGLFTPGVSAGDMTEFRKEYKQRAASGLKRLKSLLAAPGMRWRCTLARGDARTEILIEATRSRADLLIIGTHARSGLSHVLLGSVAEWVIQTAACDVLVARPVRVSFELP